MDFIDKIVGLMGGDKQPSKEEVPAEPTGQEPSAADAAQQEDQTEQTYTPEALEQILQEKRQEWQQEQDTENQKRLQSLPEAERMKTELFQLKSELARKDLQVEIISKLEENKLPSCVADLVQYGDRESTMQSLDHVISTMRSAIDEGVKNRLRGRTPAGLNLYQESGDAFCNTLKNS